ncbi:hypothetical protein AUM89_10770 [Cronobacter sakazakii]|uniref:hypothetical protein n=1 Tax=Franconibacter TaxID=1649295 RepID=UPI000463DE8E|nr:hypothetical protein [Franconibacter pulveris]EGT4305864.1 hypothetical protein [Cronobacter sakazakii]EGT4326162.1 hypothetical protein [Cronobacter sakazakii]EGT4363802.1 hypothetical protein [Cronobacter sakazakii]
MTYSEIVSTIAIIISIVAVPASGLISYRVAIKGEKRKEYNSIVLPVRLEIIKQIDSIKANDFYHTKIQREQILLICDLLDEKRSHALLDHYERYAYATSFEGMKSNFGEYGLISIGDTKPAFETATKLLKLLPLY